MIDFCEARACHVLGPCVVVPMGMIKGGVYPTLSAITFFGSLGFGLIVLYQTGTRLLSGYANETISRWGHILGSLMIVAVFGAGYLFAPDIAPGELKLYGIDVDRTWGPSTLMLALTLGHLALYSARQRHMDDATFEKLDPKVPVARALTAPVARIKPPTQPPPVAVPRAMTPQKKLSTPIIPAGLKKKIQFFTVSAEVSVAGIDAHREDGQGVLVMWRDVVGLVVRRLPPELESHPFVDIVSTAGMTLRILPWSKLTGEPIESGTADARMRAFVLKVKPRCPDAKLDRATQLFLDSTDKQPAQLNMDLLAKHDQALA